MLGGETAMKRLFMPGGYILILFVLGGLASAEVEVIKDRFDGTTRVDKYTRDIRTSEHFLLRSSV